MHLAFHLRSFPALGSHTIATQAQLSYIKKDCLIKTFPNMAITVL